MAGVSVVIWAIELDGSPPCWIRRHIDGDLLAFRFTFQWKEAQKFTSRDAADREMLRLRLGENWLAMRYDDERTNK